MIVQLACAFNALVAVNNPVETCVVASSWLSRDECGWCSSLGSTSIVRLSGGSSMLICQDDGACLKGSCTEDFVLAPAKN